MTYHDLSDLGVGLEERLLQHLCFPCQHPVDSTKKTGLRFSKGAKRAKGTNLLVSSRQGIVRVQSRAHCDGLGE